MALMKKQAPFEAPTMAETDTDYAARVERLGTLNAALSSLRQEQRRIERELADTPAPAVRPSVAALLGDETVDARTALRSRLAEVNRSISDHDAAVTLQKARVEEARGRASLAVCEAVKAEYGMRVAAMVTALEAAHEARLDLRRLVDDLEADGVSWTRLGVFEPVWLGDARDGHVQRIAREAKAAGYV
ncbi:hypothetical protein [Devosia salina]|uniref:Uncharacterized protein n=1 Tax=Devosia salina TaxID=2860336 RepID=A0ABX8W8N3_9HYPH|nr:hypothetical protein [Devosia salina]QYO75329.1 hypothetical protein K1X15_11775 [Devosia salina]